jgi:hypothetical protein
VKVKVKVKLKMKVKVKAKIPQNKYEIDFSSKEVTMLNQFLAHTPGKFNFSKR